MTRSGLLMSAVILPHVSTTASDEYHEKSPLLVQKVNEIMLRRADVKDMIGVDNLQLMQDNHTNHVRFLKAMLTKPNPEVLVDTILWVFRAYRSRGFSSVYWAVQLNTWITVMERELSAMAYAEILPYYEWMQVNVPTFSVITDIDLATYQSTY